MSHLSVVLEFKHKGNLGQKCYWASEKNRMKRLVLPPIYCWGGRVGKRYGSPEPKEPIRNVKELGTFLSSIYLKQNSNFAAL